MTRFERHGRSLSGDGDPIGAAHDEIVGDPIRLDVDAGDLAYVIQTVVYDDGRHVVEYADPES